MFTRWNYAFEKYYQFHLTVYEIKWQGTQYQQ